jgi:hypothetical protein
MALYSVPGILFKWWLKPSAVCIRTNIIHMITSVMKIKYIMYSVQDCSVLDKNAVRPVI